MIVLNKDESKGQKLKLTITFSDNLPQPKLEAKLQQWCDVYQLDLLPSQNPNQKFDMLSHFWKEITITHAFLE